MSEGGLKKILKSRKDIEGNLRSLRCLFTIVVNPISTSLCNLTTALANLTSN